MMKEADEQMDMHHFMIKNVTIACFIGRTK